MLQDSMTKEPVNFSRIQEVKIENTVFGPRFLQIGAQLAAKSHAVFTWQFGDSGRLQVTPKQDVTKDIQFKPASQDYGTQFVSKNLNDANRKMLLFLLDRVMDHGTMNEDCTYVGEISSFRAVLWWDQYPKDLDLYATYAECYDQIYEFETALQSSMKFRSLNSEEERTPKREEDSVEASKDAGPTTDLWIWSINPTPSYSIYFDNGLAVTRKGKPVYSKSRGTGHPREFATDEFDELKKWYKKYPDTEQLTSFYLPHPDEPRGEAKKHRAATGNPLLFFASHPRYSGYTNLDIRGAGYDICPIVSCASRLNEIKNGKKVVMYDKKQCTPTVNQRSKWVSWVSPLLMHLEKAYGRREAIQHAGSVSFANRLTDSLKQEQERKRKLVEKGELSNRRYERFLKSMAMRKAKGASRVELDIDHRDGFGPETITMTNVPPGIYKFAVHAFTEDMYLRDATPTVKFWLGDTVLIHCKLDKDSCADPQYSDIRWWNVATLAVEELPTKVLIDGAEKQSYRVRLLSNEKKREKRMQWRDLPTREDLSPDFARTSRRRYYRRVDLVYENEDKEEEKSESNNWTLQEQTCASTCWIEKGDGSKCMAE
ncbi:unnamed protein product [Amoebophrya sp. A25]|nr:unnamed protein product [Amoebophrya sp. A25]|eukprot:GSA25T00025081001.1